MLKLRKVVKYLRTPVTVERWEKALFLYMVWVGAILFIAEVLRWAL